MIPVFGQSTSAGGCKIFSVHAIPAHLFFLQTSLRGDQLSVQRAAIGDRIQQAATMHAITEVDLRLAAERREEPKPPTAADEDNDGDEGDDAADVLAALCGATTGRVKETDTAGKAKGKATSKAKAVARGAVLPPSSTTSADRLHALAMAQPSGPSRAGASSSSLVTRAVTGTLSASSAAAEVAVTPTKSGRRSRGSDGFDPETYLDNDGMGDLKAGMAELDHMMQQDILQFLNLAYYTGLESVSKDKAIIQSVERAPIDLGDTLDHLCIISDYYRG